MAGSGRARDTPAHGCLERVRALDIPAHSADALGRARGVTLQARAHALDIQAHLGTSSKHRAHTLNARARALDTRAQALIVDAQGDLAKATLRMHSDEQEVSRCRQDMDLLTQKLQHR